MCAFFSNAPAHQSDTLDQIFAGLWRDRVIAHLRFFRRIVAARRLRPSAFTSSMSEAADLEGYLQQS